MDNSPLFRKKNILSHVTNHWHRHTHESILRSKRMNLESARARGRNGGRPSKNHKQVDLALKMYNSKQYSISEITKATEISKTSGF